MDQRAENACGGHTNGFDYTCDDCMLPYNHRDDFGVTKDDKTNYKKRTKTHKKYAQTKKPPF
jgi:hypothetical protein